MNDTNTIQVAIENLDATSAALLKFANKEQNYNHEYANLLASIAFEMRKNSADLREIEYSGGMS